MAWLLLLTLDPVEELLQRLAGAAGTNAIAAIEFELGSAAKEGDVGRLLRAIDDMPDWRTRAAVMRVVGSLSREPLRKLLRKHEPAFRAQTAISLHLRGDDRGLEYLLGELRSSPADRMGILEGLLTQRVRAPAIPEAAASLLASDAPEDVKTRALDLLLLYRAREHGEAVAAWFRASRNFAALVALMKLGSDATVQSVLQETDASTKVLLARAFAARQEKSLYVLQKLMGDGDPTVRDEAALAFLSQANASHTEQVRALASWKNPNVRVAAARVLLSLDDPLGLQTLLQERRHESSWVRRDVVEGLGELAQKRVVPPLIDALEDPAPEVREKARDSLQKVLEAIFPYLDFDFRAVGYDAASDQSAGAVARIREWWARHSQEE